jgi:hypothetical protein
MFKNRETVKVLKQARKMLRSGMAGSLVVRKSGCVEQPIPIVGLNHDLHSWFVPVTIGELLVGFFEFRPDLVLKKYSSFQRHEESLDGCPLAKLWIDAKSIRHRIDEKIRQDEKVHEPFLTYDKSPSRLAWAIVLEAPDGTSRILYVAGNEVWEVDSANIDENSFGHP